MGTPMHELEPPAFDQIEAHIWFVESDGAEGEPANLSGVDLRPSKKLAQLNLAALRGAGATFYGLECGV